MFARITGACALTIAGAATLGACTSVAAPAAPPSASAWAQACAGTDDWDAPGPPFRIHGNTYYVGTCGIAAILITGSEGHVLIDGGTARGGALIAANVAQLGFRMADVKVLLHSHEHFDHVGGIAHLQQISGARLIASPAAAPVLRAGRESADDPQAGTLTPFAPARVDAVLGADGVVTLGDLRLVAIPTPGHTAGALTWQWQSCAPDGSDCRWIVYADSLSAISADGYRFSDHPAGIAAFRAGLARLAALDCDIIITPHPGASDLRGRALSPAGLADPSGCAAYAAAATRRLDTRLAHEAGSPPQ